MDDQHCNAGNFERTLPFEKGDDDTHRKQGEEYRKKRVFEERHHQSADNRANKSAEQAVPNEVFGICRQIVEHNNRRNTRPDAAEVIVRKIKHRADRIPSEITEQDDGRQNDCPENNTEFFFYFIYTHN